MLYYELKKIWVKPGTKIVLLILAITLVLSCYFAIHGVYYVNENGENEYGIEAIHKLKAAKKEWAGLLTEEVIAEVIAENNRINDTEMGRSETVHDSNIVFGWKQGFYDIRWMLVRSFCKFRESDYYVPDYLAPEDARFFYGNRLLHLQEWLEEDAQQNLFTEAEQDFLIRRYQDLEAQAPLYYDYADGWNQLFEWAAQFCRGRYFFGGIQLQGGFRLLCFLSRKRESRCRKTGGRPAVRDAHILCDDVALFRHRACCFWNGWSGTAHSNE